LRASLGDSLYDSLYASLGDSLYASLGDSLRASLYDSLRASLGDSLYDSLSNIVFEAFWGQQEAWWIAYYLFPAEQQLVTYDPKRDEQLGLWAEISRSTGWWFPYNGVVVCTERPIKVAQETVRQTWPFGVTSRRLHCEDGPALEYRDGWKVYAWHGTRVPDWVIENPTAAQAMKEPNSEIRRCALESLGWDQAVRDLKLKAIATAPDPANSPHELRLFKLPEEIYGRPVNLLLMVNGSPDRSGDLRQYGETVPANILDPIEAAAWQYDVAPDVYAQLARRT
jgi:hypothetical protein